MKSEKIECPHCGRRGHMAMGETAGDACAKALMEEIEDLETQLLTAKFTITRQAGEIISLRPKSAPSTFSEVQSIMDEISREHTEKRI